MQLETMTLAELERQIAAQAAQREHEARRDSMLARMDRPLAGHAGTLCNGVLFGDDENLFSGTAAERYTR